MALNSFQLFLGQVQSSPDELKLKVLQVIFDILLTYDYEFFSRSQDIVSFCRISSHSILIQIQQADKIVAFLLHTLENEESNVVQAVLCIGISKLLLFGLITDDKVILLCLLS